MRVVSFNINGVRARLHQLQALIERHNPDLIGLQETKVADDQFPLEALQALGYQVAFHGQKGHYGVALMYRDEPLSIQKGFTSDDELSQRRLVRASFRLDDGRPCHVFNGYFPQGENRDHPTKFPDKARFYEQLTAELKAIPDGDHIIVMGDMNVAPLDLDIGIGEDNRKRWLRTGKCCFLPEEREWLDRLTAAADLQDCWRQLHPQADDRFSWFDYRSRGFEREPRRGLRIDLILASQGLMQHCEDAGVDYDVRAMERPSDHCPVWSSFFLKPVNH